LNTVLSNLSAREADYEDHVNEKKQNIETLVLRGVSRLRAKVEAKFGQVADTGLPAGLLNPIKVSQPDEDQNDGDRGAYSNARASINGLDI
jgi:hypothetical protein